MGRYVVSRLFQAIPVVLLLSIGSFLMLHFVPGDPAQIMAGEQAPPSVVEAMRERLGLNKSLPQQIALWYRHLLHGNLGYSFFLHEPVDQAIAQRIGVTFSLAVLATLLAIVLGIAMGTVAAVRQNTVVDQTVTTAAVLGLSIPNFWFGLMLIAFLSVRVRLFPAGGYVPLYKNLILGTWHLFLPALTLSLPNISYIARMTRASVIEVLQQEYITTARSKGLSGWVTVYKHALKNALIPVVTVIGNILAVLMAGTVITETIFFLPGFGRLIIEGIDRRDYPLIQGAMLFVGVIFVLINLLVDVLYAFLDPRVTYQ